MSRLNVQILVATALLGVLLVVVWQLFAELTAPAEAPPDTAAGSNPPPPAAPLSSDISDADGRLIIAGYADLVRLLDERGLAGVQLLGDSARWYQARGFLGADPLLGIDADAAPLVYYEALDDATLEGLRQARDMAATQVLASRRALDDPFAALELYREAAGLGSVAAYLQIASLYSTLASVPLDNLRGNPQLLRRVSSIRPTAALSAFGWLMAGLRDSGPAIAAPLLIDWAQRLFRQLPENQRGAACQLSERFLLQVAGLRRNNGLAPFPDSRPPVFLSVPALEESLPCTDTSFPYYSMLDTDDCRAEAAIDGSGHARLLYLCANE